MTNQYIYVKPTEGSRVRNPENNYSVIPVEGTQVIKSRYFIDRLNAGELIEITTATEKTGYAPEAEEKAVVSGMETTTRHEVIADKKHKA
jgi:hypothetical protein